MLDHLGVSVSDFARSKAFYAEALAPLGIALIMEATAEQTGNGAPAAGFGANGRPFFWIGAEPVQGSVHVAFTAPDRDTVRRFHAAALAAGGMDNGTPGVRAHYHADYYGAFVRDPDGHNIEAVCHAPESTA